MNTALVYDIEIVNAIPDKTGARDPGFDYCEGWHDHANMGISVIGAYDYFEDRYRVFCWDNFDEFFTLAAARAPLVTFNGIGFDDKVIACQPGCLGTFLPDAVRYDLLREIWVAAGLSPTFGGKSHGGFGLDAMAYENFGTRKTGNGALAPMLWQRGQIGKVVDYCLNDVLLTKMLYDRVLAGLWLRNPKTGTKLTMRNPEQPAPVAI